MYKNLTQAYLDIFRFKPEQCKVIGLRKMSRTNHLPEMKIEALITADTKLNDVKCSESNCNKVRNRFKKKIAGFDILNKIKLINENDKKKKFMYTVHVVPENLISFEIVNGKYYIRAIGIGILE